MFEFEKNDFVKIKKNRKVIIEIYNDNSSIKKYEYEFETNVINNIPETDIKFALALNNDNDEFVNVFINLFNIERGDCASPTRTYFPGLTDQNLFRYMFDYKENNILKIGIDANSYLEISII